MGRSILRFIGKLIKFVLIAIVVIFVLLLLAECYMELKPKEPVATTSEITNSEELGNIIGYNHSLAENEISRTYIVKNDLELFAKEGYCFRSGYYGSQFEGITLDGGGHTITIKGDEGTLNDDRKGLFSSIKDCTIKNLTIIYQITLKVDNAFGGLACVVENSTIENVHIVYVKGVEYVGGETYYFGGLAAQAHTNSVINNCSVKGDIKAKNGCVGGLLGSLGASSKVTNSHYIGGIEATLPEMPIIIDRTNRACCGGLVGVNYGTISASYVKINKLNVLLNAATFDISGHGEIGSLVGHCSGIIKDCYVDIAANASIRSSKGESFFSRDLCSGLLCGHLSEGARLDNVYIDVSNWSEWDGETVSSKYSIGGLFGISDTQNINNVNFVDVSHNVVLKREAISVVEKTLEEINVETKNGEQVENGLRFEYLTETVVDRTQISLTLRYVVNEETDYFKVEESVITVDGVEINVLPTSIEDSERRFEYLFTTDDIHLWRIEVFFDFDNLTAELGVLRSIKSSSGNKFILRFDGVNVVDDYYNIVMDIHQDVIGAEPSVWTRDSRGKPIFIQNKDH